MKYNTFATYLIPIDADENNFITIKEMNVAMTRVSKSPLTKGEIKLLQQRTNGQSFAYITADLVDKS